MKLKNLIIGLLLIGIFVNVGVVFAGDSIDINPEWKYKLEVMWGQSILHLMGSI
ncbi:hypothetical protein [Methanothermococcus sp.]|uniref:hypothetical protein n=1 Tax=Methanothermococcus sp. TaxID=2614238 RepID=UPI0025D7C9F0|nr:hypothetical protein [Methanothermococcus sp.]